MKSKNFEFQILVKNKPVSEYFHKTQTFIEGRQGSEFELKFTNLSYVKVLAVFAVDGLCVLDGKPAGDHSQGYVVDAQSTITIPGWTLDAGNVTKFFFQDKNKSYVASTNNGTTNAGVVGVMVYEERHNTYPYARTWYDLPLGPTFYPLSNKSSLGGGAVDSGIHNVYQNTVILASACSTTSNQSFDLGTGFGKKTAFQTNEVNFNRGTLVGEMAIYYDSRKNLESRGIVISRPKIVSELPRAFPLRGCKPPPGWVG